jgi:hypothetical protein
MLNAGIKLESAIIEEEKGPALPFDQNKGTEDQPPSPSDLVPPQPADLPENIVIDKKEEPSAPPSRQRAKALGK